MSNIRFSCKHEFPAGFNLSLKFTTSHQVVALFGPSGSGKTSVLSMMAGFNRPDQGKIEIGERTLFDSARRINVPSEKRNVGLVEQDHLLFPHMNVEANLCFGMRRKKFQPRFEPVDLYKRICRVFELETLLCRYPSNLSGGESQRVAIGRALLSQPEILLLDEPLSSLDVGLTGQILNCLEQIIGDLNIPVIFASHRQGHVRRLADWVIVMEGGRKIAEGIPSDALSHARPMAWTKAMGPVNLLKVDQVRLENQRWVGNIDSQILQMPNASVATEKIFVQFTPRDVTLSRSDVDGLSARNHLAGTIRKIVSVPGSEFVAIDIGQIVWAEVTSQSVEELELRPGTKITCLIKTQSLEVVD